MKRWKCAPHLLIIFYVYCVNLKKKIYTYYGWSIGMCPLNRIACPGKGTSTVARIAKHFVWNCSACWASQLFGQLTWLSISSLEPSSFLIIPSCLGRRIQVNYISSPIQKINPKEEIIRNISEKNIDPTNEFVAHWS